MPDNPSPIAIDLVFMREQITKHLSLDDIRDLCFELGIDYENLPGDSKKAKARELLIYCRSRAKLDGLVQRLKISRPEVDWEPPVGETKRGESTPEERIYTLVVGFNRNRHRRISDDRTRVADEVAFQMRELAPELEGAFDISSWLTSDNIGKRVAAVEYLDWKQDTEFFAPLLNRLFVEQPFVQFHILITLSSMLDQLTYEQMRVLQDRLGAYDPDGDGSRVLWAQTLRAWVEEWFRAVE